RNMIGTGSLFFFPRWWEQNSLTSFIRKDGGRESDSYLGPFLAFLRQRFSYAQLAAFAKLRDGAEKALWRFRRAQRSAKLHHGLIPVARGLRIQIGIGNFLQLVPAPRLAEVTAQGAEAGED